MTHNLLVNFKYMKEKILKYIKEEQQLLKRLKLDKRFTIRFPNKTKIPLLSRICVKILRSQGGIIDIEFYPKQ